MSKQVRTTTSKDVIKSKSPPSPPTATRTIGNIIADAMEKVGNDGTITVEEAKSHREPPWKSWKACSSTSGYLSPYFVTDSETMEAAFLENAYILHPREEGQPHLKDLLPTPGSRLPRLASPLLIIAEDVEGEALATLVVNKIRGILRRPPPSRLPGFGDRRKAMLEDIAILTGGLAFSDDLGLLP